MSVVADYDAGVLADFLEAPGSGRPEGSGWVHGEARDALTGTWVRVHLRCAAGTVLEVCYEVRGCPHTVAAAARLARDWVGVPLAEARWEPRRLLVEMAAPVAKLGRLLVVESACREALRAARATD